MLVGSTLQSRYKIIKLLGKGGFGETYLAEDLHIPINPKPRCVVKRLQPQAISPEIVRLFQQEGEFLYKLGQKYDRIPTLSAYFQENNEFYLIQELIDGEDLSAEILPGQPWQESDVVQLLQEILEVLSFVHEQNVIHRDIKPQNLMRRQADGKLVLIDFGAVKEVSAMQVTAQGNTSLTVGIGTPGYMPDEQANGKPKLSSDVYAVGMLGIQALTGLSPSQLREDPRTGEVIWRSFVQSKLNDKLANILDTMVKPHFSQRYPSAVESLQALNSTLGSSKPAPKPQTPPSKPPVALKAPDPPPVKPAAEVSSSIPPTVLPDPAKVATTPTVVSQSLNFFNFEVVTVNANGEIANRNNKQSQFFVEDLGNSVTLEMIAIPGGKLIMGSPGMEKLRNNDEGPLHEVSIKPFYMGKFAVMQSQWQTVMGSKPSNFKGNKRPVKQITWHQAREFCQKLSQQTGRQYRLPSEAEWEYACRAGTTTPFYFGETITPALVNYNGNFPYGAAPKGQYCQSTTDVGSFPPNAFGLYDMHGNVWEWCQDEWHKNYSGAPTDGSAWEAKGNENANRSRLLRGGSWYDNAYDCRSANRLRYTADFSIDYISFRVVVSIG